MNEKRSVVPRSASLHMSRDVVPGHTSVNEKKKRSVVPGTASVNRRRDVVPGHTSMNEKSSVVPRSASLYGSTECCSQNYIPDHEQRVLFRDRHL